MKKRMKLTALLASAVLLCGNCLTGYAAEDLYYFGITDNGIFQKMQMVDVGGWLQSYILNSSFFSDTDENTPYYVCTCHRDRIDQKVDPSDPQYYIWADEMYLTVPNRNLLMFALRTDLDLDPAVQQAKEIVQKHFPAGKISRSNRALYVTEQDEAVRTWDNAVSLMQELAQAGLITEFYSWGQTAQYMQIEHGFLTVYGENGRISNPKNYDWAAIEAWVHKDHPECEFVCITDRNSALAEKLTVKYWYNSLLFGDTFYAVIPPEYYEFEDHFALAMDLYHRFDLDPCAGPTSLESSSGQMTSRNILTIAGDANLDCSADIEDAVLIARFTAEDREAVINDQGKENADVTHDGNVDAKDGERLLQYIAKKISYADLAADPVQESNEGNQEHENPPANEETHKPVAVPILRTEPKLLSEPAEPNKRICTFREASDADLAMFGDAAAEFDRDAYNLICAEISGAFSDAAIVSCTRRDSACQMMIVFPYDLSGSAEAHTVSYLLAFPKETEVRAEQLQAVWDAALGTEHVTPQEEFQQILSDVSDSLTYLL